MEPFFAPFLFLYALFIKYVVLFQVSLLLFLFLYIYRRIRIYRTKFPDISINELNSWKKSALRNNTLILLGNIGLMVKISPLWYQFYEKNILSFVGKIINIPYKIICGQDLIFTSFFQFAVFSFVIDCLFFSPFILFIIICLIYEKKIVRKSGDWNKE